MYLLCSAKCVSLQNRPRDSVRGPFFYGAEPNGPCALLRWRFCHLSRSWEFRRSDLKVNVQRGFCLTFFFRLRTRRLWVAFSPWMDESSADWMEVIFWMKTAEDTYSTCVDSMDVPRYLFRRAQKRSFFFLGKLSRLDTSEDHVGRKKEKKVQFIHNKQHLEHERRQTGWQTERDFRRPGRIIRFIIGTLGSLRDRFPESADKARISMIIN